MVQKTSPFIESKYGWNLGESNWNNGADENFLKFGFMLDNGVDGVVSSLPQTPVNGTSYYLTTDNRFYFVVDGTYYSAPCPKWFTFKLKVDGQKRIYDGSGVVNLPSEIDVSSYVSEIKNEAKDFSQRLLSSQGSELIGYSLNSTGYVRTVSNRLKDIVFLKDFGVKADGIVDDTSALQNALLSGYKIIQGTGSVRVTSTLQWPMGVILQGNPSGSFELIFDMPAGSDGIIVTEPTSGFNYVTGIRDVLVTSKSRGRYMFTSPKSSNVWNRQCYFDFTGLRVRDFDKSKTILTNYWDRILNLGDTKGVTLERFQMFGGLPGDAPSGEIAPCRGVYINSATGAIGVNIRNGSFTSLSFPIEFSDGVEGYTLTDFEIVNCWVGIDHTNASGEPGGFIDNVHINANYRGVRFLNRVEFTVGGISVYRSPSFAAHANGWAAVEMNSCNFKGVIESINVVPNNSTVGTNCAIKAVNCSANSIQIGRLNVSTKLSRVLDFDSVSGIHVDHVYARGADNLLVIANSTFNSSNLHLEDVDSNLSDSLLVLSDASTSLSTVTVRRTPRGATNQPTSLSITTSGDYLIYPKSALNGVSISGSAINANLILSKDGATGGDTIRIKFVNGSATGNKLNICNGANTTVLNVINSGNTNRYIAEYTFSGTNWACNFIHLDLDATLRT